MKSPAAPLGVRSTWRRVAVLAVEDLGQQRRLAQMAPFRPSQRDVPVAGDAQRSARSIGEKPDRADGRRGQDRLPSVSL
jgi:hypothetical protein